MRHKLTDTMVDPASLAHKMLAIITLNVELK